MTTNKHKYYVVWEGREPGIYDNWNDAKEMIENYPGARFKSFPTLAEATAAYRGDETGKNLAQAFARHKFDIVNYAANPLIRTDAIAVDGACAGNPGLMEYRGVRIADGKEVFHLGPLPGGTNNIAEYIAIIHAAAALAKAGDSRTPIYSDSKTALSWIRRGHSYTKISPNGHNEKVIQLLARADAWRQTHKIANPILKWDTDNWGEIPADFGRK